MMSQCRKNAIIFRRGWVGWLKENAVVIVDLVILVVGGFVVCGLVAFHTYLMLKGLSTWEAVSRERITYLKYLDEDYNPFDEGVVKNIFSFLCDCRLHKWESLYAKKADVASRAV